MSAFAIESASRRAGAHTRRPRWAKGLSWILFAAAVAYFVAPVVWLFVASTKSSGDLYTTPGFAFGHWNFWQNLADLSGYRSGIFWRWLLNSAIYSVLGSAITTLICALCGYALAIYRFRGRTVLLEPLSPAC